MDPNKFAEGQNYSSTKSIQKHTLRGLEIVKNRIQVVRGGEQKTKLTPAPQSGRTTAVVVQNCSPQQMRGEAEKKLQKLTPASPQGGNQQYKK